jgi:hypothetical protein
MFHAEEVIQGLYIIVDVLFCEVRMVGLQSKMLENLGSLCNKEPSNFFNASLVFEKFRIFQFCSVLRVLSHQVFTQVNARVESLSDTGVN